MFSERIVKVLINNGFCTHRGAPGFLRNNQVLVNGCRVVEPKTEVRLSSDEISINGMVLEKTQHVYLLLNKPLGYVCSSVSDRHPLVYSLVKDVKLPPSSGLLHSAGRLDSDTSGLLLLSTNGKFTHMLSSPEFAVQKKYCASLEKPVAPDQQNYYRTAFRSGIILPPEKKSPEEKALPAEIEFLSDSECIVTVCEGKFHEVRRMFLALQNKVTALKRLQFGPFVLPLELKEGEYVELSEAEVEKLFSEKPFPAKLNLR